MMDDGSRHDPGHASESEPALEDGSQPGWFARAWSRVRRAWRWVRRKHEPISEGIETAGRGWTRAARTAARIGRSLARMGTVIERNGAILAKGRGRARRFGRNLVSFGTWLNGFGVWLTKTGRKWAPLGEDIEDIGGHLGELDIAPLPAEEDAAPLPEPEPEPPALPAPTPEREPKPAPRPDPQRVADTAKRPPKAATRRAAVGDLPAEVQAAIAGLGKRPRADRLRAVIQAICRSREWTTVKELSVFVGVSAKTLRSRHLPAMIEEGRLVRRFPDRPRHRDQAYGAPEPNNG